MQLIAINHCPGLAIFKNTYFLALWDFATAAVGILPQNIKIF